jgi:hypothetical protein
VEELKKTRKRTRWDSEKITLKEREENEARKEEM